MSAFDPKRTLGFDYWRSGSMEVTKRRIRETIELAFDGVPRPSMSLRQFLLTDERGLAGDITEEEWRLAGIIRTDSRWQDISDLEIEHCECQLAHMQAEEFRYYLPAYMVYSIVHANRPIWESSVPGGVIFGLTPSSEAPLYNLLQYSLLQLDQRNAIAEFLRYMASNAAVYLREDAEGALTFWKECA
ncbi:hypothetical protein QLQ15_05015 [Lysobacter sp. LF1]|uniref:Uncharacterized protein n=1 Tax=Lysobacter stagni TaxID=3045172 RepID=A0ABT6XDP4_9GAMM|nr:DUF6714 family protein [Lysobacter sp. LF1]MDI9238271.1 hypothetical protein [Lysobacter sp. LF1]